MTEEERVRFVVVTGMSGSGKSTAMKFLEDAGFFCVDNLPVPLIEKFMELLTMPNNEISKAALGLDVRAEQTFGDAIRILDRMRQNGFVFEILFMDAGDDVLVKRYKETRRMHPLCTPQDNRIEDGIRKERKILSDMKKRADYIIDTSKLLLNGDLTEERIRLKLPAVYHAGHGIGEKLIVDLQLPFLGHGFHIRVFHKADDLQPRRLMVFKIAGKLQRRSVEIRLCDPDSLHLDLRRQIFQLHLLYQVGKIDMRHNFPSFPFFCSTKTHPGSRNGRPVRLPG